MRSGSRIWIFFRSTRVPLSRSKKSKIVCRSTVLLGLTLRYYSQDQRGKNVFDCIDFCLEHSDKDLERIFKKEDKKQSFLKKVSDLFKPSFKKKKVQFQKGEFILRQD